MKKTTGIVLLISIATLAGSSEVKTTASADNGTIETRVEYWKAHAYVNLSLMQYQVNHIISDTINRYDTTAAVLGKH